MMTFLYPTLYLAAMGVGLGSLIDRHVHAVTHVSYLAFIGPGLLAGSIMQVATNESTYAVMAAIKWEKIYFAMLATPLTVRDVLRGHLGWVALRICLVAAVFLGVLASFSIVESWWALLALPACVLVAMAFAAPIMAFSSRCENDSAFTALYRFGVVPLFLFSGTFYPIRQLPGWLEPVAYATPLYHGVHLLRSLVLGGGGVLGPLEDVAYLSILFLVGYVIAIGMYEKRLRV